MSIGHLAALRGRILVRAAHSRPRVRLWALATVIMVVAGTAGAFLAARSVAARDTDRAAVAFTSTSTQVASTLQLALQHEEDLIISAAAFVGGKTETTETELVQWAAAVQALKRYPELIGLGQAVLVPASQLAAFGARMVPGGTFKVTPPGARPFYCFATIGFGRTIDASFPVGFDYCSRIGAIAGPAARDSGQGAYLPYREGTTSLLVVLTPVYRGGVLPPTVTGRRAAFQGWIGTEVAPKVILDRARANHPDLAVSLTYTDDSVNAVFRSGAVPQNALTTTTSLHNGWTVRTSGPALAAGVLANGNALIVLVGGIALNLVLAALLFVLATGRARALSLVSEKTDELRHQALHDPLTGLPNRALIMDRTTHLLARNLRTEKVAGALFIDLDGFKNVNDTLGHGVGDRLLEAVASRLTRTLRDADTVGRLGGDEFIVLLDDASLPGAAEMIAERVLHVVRQPFDLEGAAEAMLITASIGIALGHRETPEELLREADVALYQAKAAGRNCFEVFRPDMSAEGVKIAVQEGSSADGWGTPAVGGRMGRCVVATSTSQLTLT